MMPVGMAIVYELFPPKRRGMAMGNWGVAIMAAPTVGPPVGGWLVTNASWRWIFLVNISIGALAVLLTTRVLRDVGFRERRRLDWFGWVLASMGIVGLVVGSREVVSWSWASATTSVVLGGAVVALGTLMWWTLRRTAPLLELRMFSIPTFAIANVLGALTTVALYARLAFLPVELQVALRTPAELAGAQDAYNDVFLVAAVLTATIAVLALFLPGRRRALDLQADRAAEHEAALAAAEA